MASKRKRSSSQEADMTLTSGAVRSMVFASSFSAPFTVKLTNLRSLPNNNNSTNDDSPLSYIQATVCDDEYKMEAYCINKRLKNRNLFQINANLSYIVSIKGYVTSATNQNDPFVCLTTLDILKVQSSTTISSRSLKSVKPKQRIQGGTAPSFLLDRAPLFDSDTLAGTQAFVGIGTQNHEPIKLLSDFLEHHSAMNTLHHSSTRNAVQSTTENYVSTLHEFEATQLNRQKASLTTNSEKSPTIQQANQVFDQYKTALEAAIAHGSCPTETFTPNTLRAWHAILCGNGLVPNAGQFRTTRVQAGGTSFVPPDQVDQQVTKFCQAIRMLEARCVVSNTAAWSATILAAAVLFGILDCHAFSDGNGRLARIVIHWAFRRTCGLPFTFNLFATPAQRRDYVVAIQATRRNLSLVPRGDVPQQVLVDVMARTGLLLPLVTLIAHQAGRAVQECNKLVAEKSALQKDQHEAQAARAFRERAAAGTCLICLEDHPNVATLCCGKAVHLNCMAQWLSSRNSCPTCRAELPSLPPRVAAPAQQQQQHDDTTTVSEVEETTTDETETTEEVEAQQHDDTTTTTYEEDDTTESVNDDTTTFAVNNNNDTTSMEEEDDDTSEDVDDTTTFSSSTRARVCCFHDCRNKPATDCDNNACGRCCVMYGDYSCERHNT